MKAILFLLLSSVLVFTACQKREDSSADSEDIQEMAQQIGEMMAAVDESGGSNSQYTAYLKGAKKTFARHNIDTSVNTEFLNTIIPTATAESCSTADTFGSCDSQTLVREFDSCTIGRATLTGTVTLTWGDGASSCAMTADGHSITREPDFEISGARGGSLAVSKSGTTGQKITRQSATEYEFTNDGIRRVLAFNNTTLVDVTSETESAITITGTSRDSRTISGGSLLVTDNLSEVSCSFEPENVTYSSDCNCATSGTWTGTCSDDTASVLTISECGRASFVLGEETQTVSFDRCYQD